MKDSVDCILSGETNEDNGKKVVSGLFRSI